MTERDTRRPVRRWLGSIAPDRRTLKADALPGAIGSVPYGMAASVLAGVNPVHGLYAGFAGPVAGGLATSTKLMVVTTTSAAAPRGVPRRPGVGRRPGTALVMSTVPRPVGGGRCR